MADTKTYIPRLKTKYNSELKASIGKALGISNTMRIPKLEKISINIGLGRAKDDKRVFEIAENTVRKITGQQPVSTIARKSIANFKLREGNPIGLKTTLRGEKMYDFLDRLISVTLPRLRDFHGVSKKSFDESGNYHIGIREHSVFPELSFEETAILHGVQVSIITTAQTKEEGFELLAQLGMPFEKEN